MVNEEKRSSPHGTPAQDTPPPPLGARQRANPLPPRGGGYLDICNVSAHELSASIRKNDPRLQELKDMGIGSDWLRVAEFAGVEAFLGLWSLLGRDYPYRIRVPSYSRFLRFQRNKRIRELGANGQALHSIQHVILNEFRERISVRHIDRIITGDKLS